MSGRNFRRIFFPRKSSPLNVSDTEQRNGLLAEFFQAKSAKLHSQSAEHSFVEYFFKIEQKSVLRQ